MNFMDRYQFWCNAGLPADVQAELAAIKNDEEELKGRFAVHFGFIALIQMHKNI